MKHYIQQTDALRAILTDLIPYEVPVRFSFMHFHRALKDGVTPNSWISRLLEVGRVPKSCLPFCYTIKRSEGKKRKLGLIHPLLLRGAAALYSEHNGIIVSLCSKSEWSLRRPVRTAKMYYAREDKPATNVQHQENPAEDDGDAQEVGFTAEEERTFQDHASSYFAYEPFNLLQKFFESKELLTIERRFSQCRRLDIAKCFDNIYTHSISWAIKGKQAAKGEKSCKQTLDGRLDAIMQVSNHGETHGILIGSELSRIFAEIILQEVDVRTKERLYSQGAKAANQSSGLGSLEDGRDFTLRRYIDDYFIFFNETKVADAVQCALESELGFYKLYLNEKKTSDTSRPFITKLSAAKREAHSLFTAHLDFDPSRVGGQSPTEEFRQLPRFRATRILTEFRLILSKLDVSIPDVSASLLKQLVNLVSRKLTLFKAGHPSTACASEWLRCVIDVAFYLFSVDIRFRTSVLIGRIVSDLVEAFPSLPTALMDEVEDSILRESVAVLNQVVKTGDSNCLEMASFLIGLKGLRYHRRIPESLVRAMAALPSDGSASFDYFSIVSLVYFAADHAEYSALQREILDIGIERVVSATSLLDDTELLCLALDLLSCPWVNPANKSRLATKFMQCLGTPNPLPAEVGAFVNDYAAKIWFFDWRSSVPNRVYLLKKELSLSY